ncbi:MAG TPA: hypothetical protein VFZ58_05105 [Candidatus Saccharimonadales bacterium]
MSTVIVSVSPCKTADRIDPSGKTRKAAVQHDATLNILIQMITARATNNVKVVELGENKITLTYQYDISHLLRPFPPYTNDVNHHSYWLYTVEENPDDEMHEGIQVIAQVVYALCSTYREICSQEIALELADKDARADEWERRNLRTALEHYGTPRLWSGRMLIDTSPSREPWRIAHEALLNRPAPLLIE